MGGGYPLTWKPKNFGYIWEKLEIPLWSGPHPWVYIFQKAIAGGGGILRIQMRKVKDFANNASILAIFLLKLCNFSQNFLLIMQFFAYWLCFSSFTENFPYFFAKYPHFGQNFWGSLKILKTTHKTGLRNDKDFSKKYTPMCQVPSYYFWGNTLIFDLLILDI